MNNQNLDQDKIQPKVISVANPDDETPRFSEKAMRDYAKKWLGDNGCESGLSEDTGIRPQNVAVISVEGIREEDKEKVSNLLQELVESLEDRFGEDVTFAKSNELPNSEEEVGIDGVPTGTYRIVITRDYQPCSDEDETPQGDDADEYAHNIALLKGSGAI